MAFSQPSDIQLSLRPPAGSQDCRALLSSHDVQLKDWSFLFSLSACGLPWLRAWGPKLALITTIVPFIHPQLSWTVRGTTSRRLIALLRSSVLYLKIPSLSCMCDIQVPAPFIISQLTTGKSIIDKGPFYFLFHLTVCLFHSAVSHLPGVCFCHRSWPESAGALRVSDLPVSLSEKRRWGGQKTRHLLCHMGRCYHRPGHMVSKVTSLFCVNRGACCSPRGGWFHS